MKPKFKKNDVWSTWVGLGWVAKQWKTGQTPAGVKILISNKGVKASHPNQIASQKTVRFPFLDAHNSPVNASTAEGRLQSSKKFAIVWILSSIPAIN